MPALIDVVTYDLEIQWLLTWYPVRGTADIAAPRIRGGVIRIKNSAAVFDAGNRDNFFLGQKLGPGDEALAPDNEVRAFADVGVSGPAREFDATFEVAIGRAIQRKRYTFPPDSRVPVLINVTSGADEPVVHDTAVALQAVVTAGRRFGLIDVLTSVVGP
jgi:hypothetical protein